MSFHMSSYSIIDYLYGNDPLLCPSDVLIVRFSCENCVEYVRINFTIPRPWSEFLVEIQSLHPNLSIQQNLNLKYLCMASFALRKDVTLRYDVVKLRLQCFYSLLHCHLSPDSFERVVSASQFLRDLIVLANTSSQVHVDLGVNVEIAILAIKCLTAVLNTCIRRKKSYARYATVVSELGLNRNDDSSTLQDMSIFSIVLASHSMLALQVKNSMACQYVAASLRLAACALSLRDYCVVNEAPLIHAVIGILRLSCDMFERNLKYPSPFTATCAYEMQVIINSCHCLEIAIASRRDRVTTLCNIGGVDTLIQMMYYVVNHSGNSILEYNAAVIEVVNGLICLISGLLISGRSHLDINADAAMQFLYDDNFPKFCKIACTMRNKISLPQSLLCSLLDLFASAINMVPVYLGTFISTGTAVVIFDVLQSDESISPLYNSFSSGTILHVVLSLVHAMAITAPGIRFVKERGILPLVLSTVIHYKYLPPHGTISIENVSNIGIVLQSILRDCEELRSQCHNSINAMCIDVIRLSRGRDIKLTVLLRLMVLLKYLGMNGESRLTLSSPLHRIVFHEKFFDGIIAILPEIFPSGRELCTQMSQRTVRPLIYFGDYTVMSAVSSLMRTASFTVPQHVLASVFRRIEYLLGQIYEAKDNIVAFDIPSEAPSRFNSTIKSDDFGFKVLCSIPNVTVCSAILTDKEELVAAIGRLMQLLLLLEWLSGLVSQSLKTLCDMNAIDSRLIHSWRELLRRLFSLYRATLIEVSSFMASQLENKVCFYVHAS